MTDDRATIRAKKLAARSEAYARGVWYEHLRDTEEYERSRAGGLPIWIQALLMVSIVIAIVGLGLYIDSVR